MNKFLGKSWYTRYWINSWWNEYCCVHNCRWIHDYQDACVDKLEKFLRGEINTKHKRAALFQMGSSSEGLVEGGKYTSSGESSPSVDVSPNRDVSYSSWWLCCDLLPRTPIHCFFTRHIHCARSMFLLTSLIFDKAWQEWFFSFRSLNENQLHVLNKKSPNKENWNKIMIDWYRNFVHQGIYTNTFLYSPSCL